MSLYKCGIELDARSRCTSRVHSRESESEWDIELSVGLLCWPADICDVGNHVSLQHEDSLSLLAHDTKSHVSYYIADLSLATWMRRDNRWNYELPA